MLERLQATVCSKLEALHKLIDNVALLDLLQSLAHAVSLSDEEYTRPVVSESGEDFAFVGHDLDINQGPAAHAMGLSDDEHTRPIVSDTGQVSEFRLRTTAGTYMLLARPVRSTCALHLPSASDQGKCGGRWASTAAA